MAVPPPSRPVLYPALSAAMTDPDQLLPKPALRAELRAARDGFLLDIGPERRAALERAAADRLMPLLEGARCVAFYMALGSEIDCGPAIDDAAARGIAIALPHVETRERPMRFLAWTPGDALETGWRGLVQPSAAAPAAVPDVVVAPLLGFDSGLARIGQGAGFYDRAFAAMPAVKKIGYGWSVQQRPAIARDPWDAPLDAVVTETMSIERGVAR